MIRLCFCTIAFQKNKWGRDRVIERPLDQILPLLASAGYDAAEIWGDHLLGLSPEAREAIAAQARGLGLAVAQISPYFDFTTSDESAAASIAQAMDVLAEARRQRARAIRVFTGKTGSPDATPQQWERCTRSLRQLCDASTTDGILWNLETHPRNLMDGVEPSLRLVREVGRTNLKLIYQPSTFGDGYLDALEALAPHVSHVHATNSLGGKTSALADGDAIDYRKVVAALERHRFDGHIAVEWMGDAPEEAATREAKYLRELLGR